MMGFFVKSDRDIFKPSFCVLAHVPAGEATSPMSNSYLYFLCFRNLIQ